MNGHVLAGKKQNKPKGSFKMVQQTASKQQAMETVIEFGLRI